MILVFFLFLFNAYLAFSFRVICYVCHISVSITSPTIRKECISFLFLIRLENFGMSEF